MLFLRKLFLYSAIVLLILNTMVQGNPANQTNIASRLTLLGPVKLKNEPGTIVLKSLRLDQILVLGPAVVEEWNSATDPGPDPWYRREYRVWNWKTGTLNPLIRFPEKNPDRLYLTGGASPKGRRYLVVRENGRPYIYLGDRHGNIQKKIPLSVDLQGIVASAMADHKRFYFLGSIRTKKAKTSEHPAVSEIGLKAKHTVRPAWLHIVDENGKLRWSGLRTFSIWGKGTRVSPLSAEDYRIVLRQDRVYVVAGPRIWVLDRTPKVVRKVHLNVPDASVHVLNVFQVSDTGEVLVQWAMGMGSGNPFFDLVRYDPDGAIIENDLLRPLREELNVDWLWVDVADGDQFVICGSTRQSKGHRCYLALWNSSDGSTWAWSEE